MNKRSECCQFEEGHSRACPNFVEPPMPDLSPEKNEGKEPVSIVAEHTCKKYPNLLCVKCLESSPASGGVREAELDGIRVVVKDSLGVNANASGGEKVNFLQVGRTIECGTCHPEKFVNCKELEKLYGIGNPCKCICHDESGEREKELMREIYDCPCHCHKTSPGKDCVCPTLTCEHCAGITPPQDTGWDVSQILADSRVDRISIDEAHTAIQKLLAEAESRGYTKGHNDGFALHPREYKSFYQAGREEERERIKKWAEDEIYGSGKGETGFTIGYDTALSKIQTFLAEEQSKL